MLETAITARDRRYRRAVGLLLLVTLGVLVAVAWLANHRVGFFSQTYRLQGYIDNVRSIQKTTPVTLAGLRVGEVDALAISDFNRIRIDLVLDKTYQSRIREGSSALIRTDLLGNARIEIGMGAPDRPMLPDGAEIAITRAPDLEALVRQTQEQLTQLAPVLANVRAITEELRKPEGALLGTLTAFARVTQEFSGKLTGYLQRVDAVLSDATEIGGLLQPLLRDLARVTREMSRAATDLAAVGERVRQGGGVLGGMTDSDSPLSRDATASVRKLRAALTGIEKLTDQLPRYGQQIDQILRQTELLSARLADASEQVPGLVDKSRRVAEDMDEMVAGIRRSALLRVLSPTEPPRRPLLEAPRDLGWPIPAAPPR
jgi:phospholipid/cholesterol/gamma-HCH transport system substrate-binding protein